MRLQWAEIRARAARFSEDHSAYHYEKGQTQPFYEAFFGVFGIKRATVATYEQRVHNLDAGRRGFIDLFWPGTLIVEQKSAGLDLRAASNQLLDYHDWLPEAQKPRYTLVSDFQRFHLIDLHERREWRFRLAELKKHVEAFGFMLGVQPRLLRDQSPANEKASRLMGRLHEALAAVGYAGHDLERLLVRLLFILFADDTGIFGERDQFQRFIEQRTTADGGDLGRWLGELFEVLNTPADQRQSNLDADLAAFEYINGRLFEERIRMPAFDNAMRDMLLDAGLFDWGEVSPAIFGALFESVIDRVTQRAKGAHYTPESSIMKVIGPLFLDELRDEFERLKARKDGARPKALRDFHGRLAALSFLDPACGAGNFLVVAYRELRELERELLRELYPLSASGMRQTSFDVAALSRLDVNAFHGIEIDEFPALIAEVALWMTDHIANTRLAEDFGMPWARIPLVATPTIRHGDALEIDWADVLPPAGCDYVLGNPPFRGAKYQGAGQRAQVRLLARLGGGTLDYVAAWFLKAGDYAAPHARIGFVATNSICQGEQVAQLWPLLFHRGRLEIAFAHRTYAWPGRAGVHCVVVGLARRDSAPRERRLFSYADGKGEPIETRHTALTAYLFDAKDADRHLVIDSIGRPINGAPAIRYGTQPIDGGHLILNAVERSALIASEPRLAPFIRPYVGAEEYLNGGQRWLLFLADAPPAILRVGAVRERLRRVREYREASARPATRAMASTPTAFNFSTAPTASFLVIPEVSSERRDYVPIGWLEPPIVPSNLVRVIADATLFDFAILTSAMHMAWLRHIGGRLESRYRYSIGLVYNTFPWPSASPAQRAKVEALARAVLDARAMPKNATSTLADLYDPDTMPTELRRAHTALDAAVDRLYRAPSFDSDRARVELLFKRYEALVQPTSAAPAANRRTGRRTREP